MNKFIAIEGVIGVGKTTLVRLLQPHFQARILLELFEENPFLPLFYADRQRYAFQNQLFFLLSRYHQQQQTVPEALHTGHLISDYTFAKDEIFAWLTLKDDELAMYGRVHAALAEKLPKPDLILFLRADHETLMRRIALRDRPYERDMNPDYIRELAAAYEAWLHNLEGVPTLTIDTNNLDFLARPSDLIPIIQAIRDALQVSPTQPLAEPASLHTPYKGDSLSHFQQFHRELDAVKGFDPDIFFNFMLLTEEMGEVARLLTHAQMDIRRLERQGFSTIEAYQQGLHQQQESLKGELADLLAYVLKLANYAGINLEEAYLQKMHQNLNRTWSRSLS